MRKKRNIPLASMAAGALAHVGGLVAKRASKWAGLNKGKRKRNPSVDEMSETWHGRKPRGTEEIEEIETFEDELAELADLEEIGVLGANCRDEWTIVFKKDRPKLATDGNGENLEVIGGDQEITGDWKNKREIPLGWLVRLVYETDKHHLEGSNGYPESYEHYFGEEYYKTKLDPDDFKTPDDWWEALKDEGWVKKAINKKLIPMLVYDSVDCKIKIAGGVYKVLDVGIKN